MPSLLERLRLMELSLVDNPANKQARVTIFKRAEEQESEMEQRASEIRKHTGVSDTVARQLAVAGACQPVEKAVRDFRTRIAEVRARDGCSHLVAMQRARKEFPDEYQSYRLA